MKLEGNSSCTRKCLRESESITAALESPMMMFLTIFSDDMSKCRPGLKETEGPWPRLSYLEIYYFLPKG
jgi:hypothetical protein